MFAADPRIQIARASQWLSQGRLPEAEREAQAALAAFGRSCGEALMLLGMVRAGQKKLEDAAALMAQAIAVLPRHAASRYAYGSVLILKGQAGQAIEQLQEAVRLAPAMVEAWYALGSQQVRLGGFADAEHSFRRVLALAPGHGETGMALGATLLELGRSADAETVLGDALRGRHHPLVVSGLAQNLALAQGRLGKHEAALASVELAEQANPQQKLHGMKGEIFAGLQRFDEALACLRAQIDATPGDESLHKKVNDILYLLGRDKDADFLASYDRAPDDENLQAAKAGFLLMARRDGKRQLKFCRI